MRGAPAFATLARTFSTFLIYASLILFLNACGGGDGSKDNDTADDTGTGDVETGVDITILSKLSGFEVVPAVNSTGEGTASLTVNDQSGVLSGSVSVIGLKGVPTIAHLHEGAPGGNGSIMLTLEADADFPNRFSVPANTVLTPEQLQSVLSGQSYWQVHSTVEPAGELRAQVIPSDSSLVRLEAPLRGEEVVAPVNTDASGMGVLLLDSSSGALYGALSAKALQGDPTAAHIHSGSPGSNGGIMLELTQDTDDNHLFSVPGNTTLSSENLAALMGDAGYFQVHSSAHALGEIRGQLLTAASEIKRVQVPLSGTEVNAAVNTTGKGRAVLFVNQSSGALFGAVRTSDLVSNATLGHIHTGAAGTNGGVLLTLEQDESDSNLFSVPEATTLTAEGLAQFLAGDTYLQIHSETHTVGEVRGQVLFSDNAVTRIQTSLSALEVVAPVNSDASGEATLLLNRTTGALSGAVIARNLASAATLGHIHAGSAGENGGIVVELEQAVDTDVFQVATGAQLSADQVVTLLSGGHYFQVHSSDQPTGAIRGQILAQDAGVLRLNVALSGSEVVPAVDTTGSGSAVLLLDVSTGRLHGGLRVDALQSSSTLAHIHLGARGSNGGVAMSFTQAESDLDLYQVPADTLLQGEAFNAVINNEAYLQVHSEVNTTGEVRGQISLPAQD